jgi:hypothetical protein
MTSVGWQQGNAAIGVRDGDGHPAEDANPILAMAARRVWHGAAKSVKIKNYG